MHVPTNRTNDEYYYNLAIIAQVELAVIFFGILSGAPPILCLLHGVLIAFGVNKTRQYIRGIDRPMKSIRRFLHWYLLCHVPVPALYCKTSSPSE